MNPKPIIAAMLAAATLSACVAPARYNDRVEKTAIYQKLDAQLKDGLAADQAQIEQLQHLVRLTLADQALFAQSSGELNESGKAMLAKLAPALQGLSGQRVVVKGFTDNVPLGPELPLRLSGNVELSQVRAHAVAEFLATQGVQAAIVYTSGLGETHPVASNDTPAGRDENRRVEIDIVAAPA